MRVSTIRRNGLRALASLVLIAALSPAAASPAGATGCATPGHVYLTVNGAAYWSGYEGNQQNGIPRIAVPANSYLQLRIGGNGIAPGTPIHYHISGIGLIDFYGSLGGMTHSNCVMNEEVVGSLATVAPGSPGSYLLTATYTAGNSGAFVQNDPVVRIVLPAPPP